MKRLLQIVILLHFTTTLFGQTQLRDEMGDVYYDMTYYTNNHGGDSYEGTPYLNKNFIPAKINNIKNSKLVRFNAVNGTVEVKVSSNEITLLENKENYTITTLTEYQKTYETHKYHNTQGKEVSSFFELIYNSDNYKIYLKENKKFFKKVKAQGYADEKPASFKFVKKEFYIIGFKGKSELPIKIPYKKKAFIEFFPKNSNSVKKYLKEKKIDINDSDDLIKVFNYYWDNLQ